MFLLTFSLTLISCEELFSKHKFNMKADLEAGCRQTDWSSLS